MKIISLGIFLIEDRGLMILYLKQFVYFCLIDSSKREKKILLNDGQWGRISCFTDPGPSFGDFVLIFFCACLLITFSIYFLMKIFCKEAPMKIFSSSLGSKLDLEFSIKNLKKLFEPGSLKNQF